MGTRPTRSKAILLIQLRDTAPADQFVMVFSNYSPSALPGAVQTVRALQLEPSAMPIVPHQELMSGSPKPFDTVFSLASEDPAHLPQMNDAITRAVDAFDNWLDRERSAVLVGNEIAITRGDGPIQIEMLLRRRPELTRDQFMQHWYQRHADLGEAVEGVRYRQNHVDDTATAALKARTKLNFEAFDGLAESFFVSTEEAFTIMTHPDVSVGAIADEKRFIDHSRSQLGFYRRLPPFPA